MNLNFCQSWNIELTNLYLNLQEMFHKMFELVQEEKVESYIKFANGYFLVVAAEKLVTKFQALSILYVFLFNLYSRLGSIMHAENWGSEGWHRWSKVIWLVAFP